MTDHHSEKYTQEKHTYMVEQYFQTNSLKIAVSKKILEIPDPYTGRRVVGMLFCL